jgi:hypothetical protein
MLSKMIGRNLTTLVIGVVMEHVNTLKAYKDLVAAGVNEEQAEAQVMVLNSSFESVATKNDLNLMEANLKHFFTWEIIVILLAIMALPAISDRLTNVFRKK